MKIKYTERKQRVLTLSGVPKGLLVESEINPSQYLMSYVEGNEKPVNISKGQQLKTLERIKKAPIDIDCFILYSPQNYLELRRYLVPWFYNNIAYSNQHRLTTQGVLPVWHFLHGMFEDTLIKQLLRQDSNLDFDLYEPLIVIDGVHTEQGAFKNDKLRDIVNLAGAHPLVILISGNEPIKFFAEKIGLDKLNYVVFGSPKTRQVL